MAPIASDNALLVVSVIGTFALGATALFAPAQLHKTFYEKGQPANYDLYRCFGVSIAAGGASGWIVANSKDTKCKKDMLKVHGAAWLAVACLNVFHTRRGTQKKELGYGRAFLNGALGSVMLVCGFME